MIKDCLFLKNTDSIPEGYRLQNYANNVEFSVKKEPMGWRAYHHRVNTGNLMNLD